MAQPNIQFTAAADSTPPNGTVVETVQLPGNEHVQAIVEATKGAITKEWEFTSAQTNTSLVTATGTERILLLYSEVTNSQATSGNPGFRLGFSTTTLPAVSASGAAGIFSSHRSLAQGSGVVRTKAHVGATGEDVLFTCDAPTAGAIRVVLEYGIFNA